MSKSIVVEKNIEMHEEEAKDYENEKTEIYNEREQERIKSKLSEVKQYIDTASSEMTALDLGCGTGNILKKLTPEFDEVIGADISDDMLSVAVSKNGDEENLRLVRGRAASLPFQDEKFDLVSVYSLLHHLPNFSDPISEICRVLKKGGVLYVDHEPVNREDFLVKSYIKFCDVLNGNSSEGLPPYNETEEREYCDYQIHHGEGDGVPTSKFTDLCEEKGMEIITTEKYLPHATDVENPLQAVLEPFTASEWLLIGRKKYSE